MNEVFIGDYALKGALSEDAFGSLHRAVRVEEGRLLRHALVRRYSDPTLRAAVGARLPEATHLSILLGDMRGLMPHCRLYPQPEAFVAYDYPPGRTLAQVIRASREQNLPLGLEHTLTVLRDLALTLDQIHGKGLEQGLLLPELVWVSFEGAVMWLDVPLMGLYRELRPGTAPMATGTVPQAGWARDFHQLACLGWQMLTCEAPQVAGAEAWNRQLQLWSDASGEALDPRLQRLFRRMVGLDTPFTDRAAFHDEAGALLRAGVHEPSTFSLSLLMHLLFREAIDQETRAMNAERTAVFDLPGPALKPLLKPRAGRRRARWVAAAAALAIACAGGALVYRQRAEESESLRTALALASRREAELEQRAQDATAKANAAATIAPRPVPVEAPPAVEAPAPKPVAPAKADPRPAALAPPPGGQGEAALLHLDASHLQGRARVKVFVNEEGRALRAMVLESTSPATAEAAQQAALRATYRPAWREGRPSRDWVEVVLGPR